ncbi:hypothetical protein E4U47_005174 [Claviceps purpurea]|nr:hypothetical protein E4U47_005174 [Claviceps purpurea]
MEFNEEHIEALLKDLTPSPPSPSPWQAEVITIEDDAAPADPIIIDDGTESDCDPLQKEVNLEDIEKMKVAEDDSDSEDEGSLGQASPSTRTGVRLAASTSVRSVNSFLVLPRAVPNAKARPVGQPSDQGPVPGPSQAAVRALARDQPDARQQLGQDTTMNHAIFINIGYDYIVIFKSTKHTYKYQLSGRSFDNIS